MEDGCGGQARGVRGGFTRRVGGGNYPKHVYVFTHFKHVSSVVSTRCNTYLFKLF